MSAALDATVADLPRRYPGPGGAVAVLRAGEVLVRHAWGFADAERRVAFTPRSLFRMCSITKQFTCAAALSLFGDAGGMDAALAGPIRAALPGLEGRLPTASELAHNQSGLPDYWAVAMLHGAPATLPFGDTEARLVIGGTRRAHFAPGAHFSYSNGNFRILSDALEARTGRSFAELLRTRVCAPAGMETAFLAADTRAMPDGAEGYEGNVAIGFRPAENRVIWTGDAGLGASLDDMIAWERHIDATRDDPRALYPRLSAPVAFADGTPAEYGFGLARSREFGHAATGHGGALRGWRSHRLHLADPRISVVVMFNHLTDARAAALDLLAALLGASRPAADPSRAAPPWCGVWFDAEAALAARVEPAAPGQIRLRNGHAAELLLLDAAGAASNGATTLRPAGDGGLLLERPGENRVARLVPWRDGAAATDGIPGTYECRELAAALDIADTGGVLYGAFRGALGRSRMEQLEPIGPDLWALPCLRALDHTPPGDWTLAIRRDAAGRVAGMTVGCWLARGFDYRRTG